MIEQFNSTHRWDPKGTTTPGQSEPGSNSNGGVLHIPESSTTGASLSDGLVLYPGH